MRKRRKTALRRGYGKKGLPQKIRGKRPIRSILYRSARKQRHPRRSKSGRNVKAASVKNYYKLYKSETPIIVRLSLRNLSFDGNILNVPLFLAGKLNKPIGIALNS